MPCDHVIGSHGARFIRKSEWTHVLGYFSLGVHFHHSAAANVPHPGYLQPHAHCVDCGAKLDLGAAKPASLMNSAARSKFPIQKDAMQIHPEVLDPIVAAGIELFQGPNPHFKDGVPKYNVLAWLFTHCAEHGIVLDTLERDRAVGRIHAAANKVQDYTETHVLTVAELREKIAALPENMPVMYQRIEDVYFEQHGWKSTSLTWDDHDRSDYIPAFGAYVTSDDDGNRVLCVHAHY